MTGKQHTAQNVGGPVITITTIRHSLQWHTLSSRTVKPLIFFSLFLFSFLFTSCSHSIVTPEEKPMLAVEPDEATCTQIWVRLKVSGPTDGYSFKLFRNGSQLGYFKKLPADTVLLDEPLVPNFVAEYELTAVKEGSEPVSSGKRLLKTLDTTNHSFTAQSFEFGNYSLSVFRDVTIIDENNIWVAGKVYQTDSVRNRDYQPYNLFHWNGNEWERMKLKHSAFCNSNPDEGVIEGTALWGRTDNKILFFARNRLSFYQNNQQSNKTCLETSIYSVWGNNRTEFYGVGYQGGILKYDGSVWESMQSGTNLPLQDIWGDTTSGQIWACGYDTEIGNTVLLHYVNEKWRKIYDGYWSGTSNGNYVNYIRGVWTVSKYFTYLTNGSCLLTQPSNDTLNLKAITSRSTDLIWAVRGTGHNNVFVAGQHGLIGHFNGKSYVELNTNDPDIFLYKLAVKGNLAIAVGNKRMTNSLSKAFIYIIKRK